MISEYKKISLKSIIFERFHAAAALVMADCGKNTVMMMKTKIMQWSHPLILPRNDYPRKNDKWVSYYKWCGSTGFSYQNSYLHFLADITKKIFSLISIMISSNWVSV